MSILGKSAATSGMVRLVRWTLFAFLITSTLPLAPAHASSRWRGLTPDHATARKGKQFTTRASWYGGKFNGRRTASGARYDQNQLTAASPNLPFGTRVLVKNPKNGRTCTVTINDRGPFVSGRGIDLSRAAARQLGISGVSPVICYADKSAPGGYRTVHAVRTKSGGYRFRFVRILHKIEYKTARIFHRFKRAISSLL